MVALSVLLSPTSRGGSAAMHALEPGAALRATEPLQNFPLGVGAARYVLLAGGIGEAVRVQHDHVARTELQVGVVQLGLEPAENRPQLADLGDLAVDRTHERRRMPGQADARP